MNQKKIVILTCWYGPYPWFFKYFVHSCAYNPSVDFIIITDNVELVYKKAGNIKIIHKTVDEIKKIASEKMGFTVSIDYAYKLCDYKPAYGYLFPELIAGYDFWGQSDIDIIYGSIRDFMTDEMLNMYDYISVRHDFATGCFSLFKNTEKMNKFFMRSKDYQLVFSDPKHFCFDECNFAYEGLRAGHSILEIDTEIESFTELLRKAELTNEIKIHFDFILIEGVPGRVVFDNGRIIYKNQFEGILYHLFGLKRIYSPDKIIKNIPDKYYISQSRIYHYRQSKVAKK